MFSTLGYLGAEWMRPVPPLAITRPAAFSDGQAFRQIVWHPEDVSSSIPPRDQEVAVRQLPQIVAGGLVAHPMTAASKTSMRSLSSLSLRRNERSSLPLAVLITEEMERTFDSQGS